MHRGIGTLLTLLLALTLGLGSVAAQEATPAGESLLAELGYPELVVTTDGTDFTVPAEVEAGRYRLVLENTGEGGADIELYQLPEGLTFDDLVAIFAEADEAETPPDVFYELVINGGVSSEAGGTGDVVLDLTPGEWAFNLYSFNEETGEEVNLPKAVTVTGEMPALDEPEVAAEVGLIDFDFEIPDGIAAGPQIWKVVNNGAQPHHLILAQVPDETTEEQVLELINAFFGPPATPAAGATPAEPALGFEDYVEVGFTGVLSTGQANWLEFDLAPGTYAALCFIPTPDGEPHVMLGMIEVFTVA